MIKNNIGIGCNIILTLQELLGKRLAAHYTTNGIKAYYKVIPNHIVSIDVNLSPLAEREYNNLPEYYKEGGNDET